MNPGMTTDWVLALVASSHNAAVDARPSFLERKLVARKDPEGENTGLGQVRGKSALPMVSLAKSAEPSALLKSRMADPIACVTARQAMSAPPPKIGSEWNQKNQRSGCMLAPLHSTPCLDLALARIVDCSSCVGKAATIVFASSCVCARGLEAN
jgi:hypothetical protein